MEDIKHRLKTLLNEIEYTHLKKDWVERLIQAGVKPEDSYKWVVELGHVVDEYERSLRFLLEMLEVSEPSLVAREIEGWLAYTKDMTIWKLEYALDHMNGHYEHYLPPDEEYDDE